jgi:hypothetical protein
MFLAHLARRPRATVKSWATAHRRAPLYFLKSLRDLGQSQAQKAGFLGELDREIRRREFEPKHLTGFFQIDPVTGQNKRNRRGRPKKIRTIL